MPRTAGSTASQTAARIEAALVLLIDSVPNGDARRELESRFAVDSSTARRYLREAKTLLAEDCQLGDLRTEAGIQVQRLRRLAHIAEQSGNLTAAASAEKSIAHIITSFERSEMTGAARLHGHTVAVAEPNPATVERKRRKHRRSISELPDDIGF
jgi:hypothetical protein